MAKKSIPAKTVGHSTGDVSRVGFKSTPTKASSQQSNQGRTRPRFKKGDGFIPSAQGTGGFNPEYVQTDPASQVPLPTTNPYPRNHPFNNAKNHEMLVQFIKQRLLFAKPIRDTLADRYEQIDMELEGFLKLSDDDRKRQRDNQRGEGMKPVDTKLSLVQTQLEEFVTFLLSVFAPDAGIFSAIAKPGQQLVADAFADKLNKDSDVAGYYRQLNKFFLNASKYNIAAMIVEWKEKKGPTVAFQPDGKPTVMNDSTTFAGNIIESLDVYNFLYDPSVHPTELAAKGEFFALVDIHRRFTVERMAFNQEIYNANRYIGTSEVTSQFWRKKPDVRTEVNLGRSSGSSVTPDWVKMMSGGMASGNVSQGYEFIHYYGWLIPKLFGLSASMQYECWRITLVNHAHIAAVSKVDTPHQMLPVAVCMPIEDDLGMQKKSLGERLIPMQTFASFLINTHQRAVRKALYGVTFYNSDVISFADRVKDDMESGKIPFKPTGMGDSFDINKHLKQYSDAPQTDRTLETFKEILDIMQKFLPTDILKQVTDLDRATEYQAAATVQGSNRGNLRLAKIIEDQAMKGLRFILMLNFFNNMKEPLEVVDPKTGQLTQVQPQQFQNAGVEFAIAEGLKAIDNMILIQRYKDLFGLIVQSQEALQQFDFISFISYLGDLMGDKTDLNQFRIANPLLTLPPEQQQQVMQLVQTGELPKLLQAVGQAKTQGVIQPPQAQQSQPGQK